MVEVSARFERSPIEHLKARFGAPSEPFLWTRYGTTVSSMPMTLLAMSTRASPEPDTRSAQGNLLRSIHDSRCGTNFSYFILFVSPTFAVPSACLLQNGDGSEN
jgi:hypothetical protein